VSLDAAIDDLYGADLEEFVAERTRLARELRDAGDRAGAQTLTKLRKPTVAAWALNQLARRNRREVDLLLDAGHRLREAQAGALQGADRDAFEQARRTEHDARSQLVREAEKLLRERGSAAGGTLDQVAESLRAGAVSEEGRELLARGRFVQPLRAQGFDLVSELAASVPPPAPGRRAPSSRREAERKAKQALRKANDELRAAEAAAREAQREAERRRAEADDAERAADEARSRVEAAAAAVEEAERGLVRARGRKGS
jgi:hypothetical protein